MTDIVKMTLVHTTVELPYDIVANSGYFAGIMSCYDNKHNIELMFPPQYLSAAYAYIHYVNSCCCDNTNSRKQHKKRLLTS